MLIDCFPFCVMAMKGQVFVVVIKWINLVWSVAHMRVELSLLILKNKIKCTYEKERRDVGSWGREPRETVRVLSTTKRLRTQTVFRKSTVPTPNCFRCKKKTQLNLLLANLGGPSQNLGPTHNFRLHFHASQDGAMSALVHDV